MSEKKNVWLLSTKRVEELYDLAKAKPIRLCINKNNSIAYDIFDPNLNNINKYISLAVFYYDLHRSINNNKTFFRNPPLNGKIHTDILNDATFNYDDIQNSLQKVKKDDIDLCFNKVYKLDSENSQIFITKCFPYNLTLPIELPGHHPLYYYWLFSYIETVCRIIKVDETNIDNFSFNFILHDQDIGLERKEGSISFSKVNLVETKDIYEFSKDIFQKNIGNLIYHYYHDPNSYIYKYIISKSTFFDTGDPSKKLLDSLDLKKSSDCYKANI